MLIVVAGMHCHKNKTNF